MVKIMSLKSSSFEIVKTDVYDRLVVTRFQTESIIYPKVLSTIFSLLPYGYDATVSTEGERPCLKCKVCRSVFCSHIANIVKRHAGRMMRVYMFQYVLRRILIVVYRTDVNIDELYDDVVITGPSNSS